MSVDGAFDGDDDYEDIYDFKRIGSFGRFSTLENFPIEFFLTTLSASQLDSLTYARDIKPESVDFEQLLQRDIDEKRVKDQIEPYITSPKLTTSERNAKTVFFPPLLVAAVPVEGKTMQAYYSKQEVDSSDKKYLLREWNEYFKLKTKIAKNGYKFQPSALSDSDYFIKKEPAVFEANLSDGISKGINLIVIDGQHRLKALEDIYKNSLADFRELAIPICILFSPNSTKEVSDSLKTNSFSVPTVPQIFRQLFVDVNKNAVQVGGHFNILLSEGNMGSSICRELCKYVLSKEGNKGLAQVEWNQKQKKLSTEINKCYYLTSIGVIEKALSETFGRSKHIYKYLIRFSEIESFVHPDNDDDHIEYPSVSWDRFSLSQKKHIEEQIKITIIPVLYRLFFKSNLFRKANEIFLSEISNIESLKGIESEWKTQYEPVLDYILEYMPIPLEKNSRVALGNYKRFELDIENKRDESTFELINYAIFQRAIILAYYEFLKVSKSCKVDVSSATEVFFKYFDIVSEYLGDILSNRKSYCQSYVYISNNINPTADTRKGISHLILSLLSNDEIRNKILSKESCCTESFLDQLEMLGYRCINSYFDLYVKNKTRDFKSSYITDRSISAEERDELYQIELIKKNDEKLFKDGQIAKNDISSEFDVLIGRIVDRETEKAREDLMKTLKLKLDIFGLDGIFGQEVDFYSEETED